MKKKNINWLEKYKRISILSLFCLVFGILCLSICFVGFSVGSSNNVAYASYSSSFGVVHNNYFKGSVTDYNYTFIDKTSTSDRVIDDGLTWYYSDTLSTPSEVNNQLVLSAFGYDSYFYTIFTPITSGSVSSNFTFTFSVNIVSQVGNKINYLMYSLDQSSWTTSAFPTRTYNGVITYTFSVNVSPLQSVYVGLKVLSGSTLYIEDFKIEQGSYFTGFVRNNYNPNGYDNGFSDGEDYGYERGLVDGADSGYAEGYNSGVQYGSTTGYAEGYNIGYSDGEQNGYNAGLIDGSYVSAEREQYIKNVGYDLGYQAGINDTTNHSFYGLFGAIFDVPVQTINGLLDFEILGVNLKGLYIGLISLTIALFILKIIFR